GKHVRLNSPRGLNGILGPVSCLTTTYCVAAENNYLPGGTEMFATWDGKGWTWRPSADPDFINFISCGSKDLCVSGPSGQVWNGKHWREAPFPGPTGDGFSSGIGGVSCPGPHFCLATGGWQQQLETGQSFSGMLAEVWRGARWATIGPPSSAQGGLGVVSCFSPANCTAIGGIAGS